MRLGRRLGGLRLMGGVGMRLVVLVLDHGGPRVVLRVVGRRWQALRRVGVMLEGARSQQGAVGVEYLKCKRNKRLWGTTTTKGRERK